MTTQISFSKGLHTFEVGQAREDWEIHAKILRLSTGRLASSLSFVKTSNLLFAFSLSLKICT